MNLDNLTDTEIAQKAAKYLEEFGWCQGRYGGSEQPACMVGSLLDVTQYYYTIYPENRPHWNRVQSICKRAIQNFEHDNSAPLRHTPATWNDMPGRTADEVIAALKSV